MTLQITDEEGDDPHGRIVLVSQPNPRIRMGLSVGSDNLHVVPQLPLFKAELDVCLHLWASGVGRIIHHRVELLASLGLSMIGTGQLDNPSERGAEAAPHPGPEGAIWSDDTRRRSDSIAHGLGQDPDEGRQLGDVQRGGSHTDPVPPLAQYHLALVTVASDL
jgi:hypothetical protein